MLAALGGVEGKTKKRAVTLGRTGRTKSHADLKDTIGTYGHPQCLTIRYTTPPLPANPALTPCDDQLGLNSFTYL